MADRYRDDPLAGVAPRHGRRPRSVAVEAEPGLVLEDATTGWCGAVVRVETAGGMRVVQLEDRHGRVRAFPLGPGFLLDGRPVELTPPRAGQRAEAARRTMAASRTASGSRAVGGAAARVARGSRLFVEGTHDAELVERVWGEDLRLEGVVVEILGGVDELEAVIDAFRPTPSRRMGVLVDHLVRGSKESRIVDQILSPQRRSGAAGRGAETVRILGHPYVDVWQSVRPQRLGLSLWPQVPRGQDWKVGVAASLGWPHDDQAEIAAAWRRILGTVRSYADLEPALLASVEELIDFVTAGGQQ